MLTDTNVIFIKFVLLRLSNLIAQDEYPAKKNDIILTALQD